ncbi:MAG: gluconate 2-dehydrogenase subunit 3 family protein [Chitinophagaceae bacterium]|nr:MAG: gluconate 2-dehydrogenase subunit 3 family protein [Chitinophagaceae bacterium]
MERRRALKYLFVMAAGTAILPACMQQESKSSFLLKNMTVSLEEEKTLAELAETLLPASATPGAKDTYAHLFALRMLDDCHEKEEQQTFTKGLKALDKMVKEKHGTTFLKATAAQRAGILTEIENKKAPGEVQAFYKPVKNLIIQGYLTSKPVMGEIFHYELVPGRYLGATPVKTLTLQA